MESAKVQNWAVEPQEKKNTVSHVLKHSLRLWRKNHTFEMSENKLLLLKILGLRDTSHALVVDKYEDNNHIAICSFTTALAIELRNELYVIVYMSCNSLWMLLVEK
jgi:hypothetical protein